MPWSEVSHISYDLQQLRLIRPDGGLALLLDTPNLANTHVFGSVVSFYLAQARQMPLAAEMEDEIDLPISWQAREALEKIGAMVLAIFLERFQESRAAIRR